MHNRVSPLNTVGQKDLYWVLGVVPCSDGQDPFPNLTIKRSTESAFCETSTGVIRKEVCVIPSTSICHLGKGGSKGEKKDDS